MTQEMQTAGVAFSLERDGLEGDGPWVEKDAAVVFRAGDYSFPAEMGGRFSVTPEDIKAALADFPADGVPLTDEHNPNSVFYKRGIGRFLFPQLLPDGTGFGGRLRLRRAVVEHMLPPGPIKLSANWHRASKRLKDVSLTDAPRITDAAAFAAFARSEGPMEHTPHGRSKMQMFHDLSAEAGALCKGRKAGASAGEAPFTSGHERDAMQAIHDTASGMGATCNVASDPPAEKLKAKREDMMASYSEAFGPAPSPRERELEARLKAVEDERAAERQAQEKEKEAAFSARLTSFGAEAEAFADSLRDRLYPYQRPLCVADYRRCAEDDLRAPAEVQFSAADGKQWKGTRLEACKARWQALKPHGLAGETAPSQVAALFSGQQPEKGMSPERRKQLLSASAFGQALLRDEAANRNGK